MPQTKIQIFATFPQFCVRSSVYIPQHFQDRYTGHRHLSLREEYRNNANADRDMKFIPAQENQERAEGPPPSLVSVYQLYDDDTLQQFMDCAQRGRAACPLRHYPTSHLSCQFGIGSRRHSLLSDLARAEYRMAQLYHQESAEEIRAVEVLGAMLSQIRAVVEAERAKAERAEEAERAEVRRKQHPGFRFIRRRCG